MQFGRSSPATKLKGSVVFRFSLRSIILATLIVALAISFVVLSLRNSILDHQLFQANSEAAQLASDVKQLVVADQKQFRGEHGDPVIAIYLHEPPRKVLLSVINSKDQPVPINMWQHNETERFAIAAKGTPGRFAKPGTVFGVCLRLLRSVNKVDFYRLTYHTDKPLPEHADLLDGSEKRLLFEFDGSPQLLVDSPRATVAIGTDRDATIAKLLMALPDVPQDDFAHGFSKQPTSYYYPSDRFKEIAEQQGFGPLHEDIEMPNGW